VNQPRDERHQSRGQRRACAARHTPPVNDFEKRAIDPDNPSVS
jgi:hypothetical protein